MIKTLIKHKIYEYAITVFFDQVYDNFIKPPMSPAARILVLSKRIQVGQRQMNAQWTMEAANDLQKYHGVDIEEELTRMMEREIEMDSRVLGGGY